MARPKADFTFTFTSTVFFFPKLKSPRRRLLFKYRSLKYVNMDVAHA